MEAIEKNNVNISPELVTAFPGMRVCGLLVELPNGQAGLEPLIGIAASSATEVVEKIDIENLATHPVIQTWRDGYRAMGLKPSKYRSSVEQLVRRSAKAALGSIGIPLADLYNQVSVAKLAPMGAYDLSLLDDGPIELRRANPERDHFDPLGGDPSSFPLTDEIAVYAQGDHILCWALNHRDAASTALNKNTKKALILSEGIDLTTSTNADDAIGFLQSLLEESGCTCHPI